MAQYLIQGSTGRVYMRTDALAKKGDMFPCDKDGRIIQQRNAARVPDEDETIIVRNKNLEEEDSKNNAGEEGQGIGYDPDMPIDEMDQVQVRAALVAEFNTVPHHATGLEKLRATLADLRASKG